jgi:hypothetical protein
MDTDNKLLKIGLAAKQYYEQAEEYVSLPVYNEWITCIEDPLKTHFSKIGFDKGKTAIPFLRFVMEKNDIGLDAFMQSNLSEDEWIYWHSFLKG